MTASQGFESSIVFSGRSALQILRAIQVRGIERTGSTRAVRLSPHAPREREVRAAVERVETAFPGLRLDRPVQLLAGAGAHCNANPLYSVSACSSPLSKGSLLCVGEGIFACCAELVFASMAGRGMDDVALLELGFELCGTYCTSLTCSNERYNANPLSSSRALESFTKRNARVKGAARARQLVGFVADGSASPRETKLALVLGLPTVWGGSGLGMPVMNYEVVADRQASLIARRTSFRCDLCWPSERMDVEYQSRLIHSNEASRIDDSRREKALRVMGWQVVGVTNDELDSMAGFDVIARMLRRSLGKDPRIRIADYHQRRLVLRSQLGLPIVD